MTDSWQQVFATYPVLRTIFDSICIAVPLSCMLAFAALFFISAVARILCLSRKRPAYDKCARQIASLGMILGWSLLVGGRIWLYFSQGEHTGNSILNFMLEMSWMLLSMGVLLASVYYILWRLLKNMPILHITIGVIGSVQNCIALASILFTCRLCAAVSLPDKFREPTDLIPSVWNAPMWNAALYTLPLIFATAAAFAAVWLALRRKHDDFGRDYYNQMLCWLARWARNAWMLLWLLLLYATAVSIWNVYETGVFSSQDAIYESSRMLLWLIPALLWTLFIKAKLPLRQRWTLYVCLLFAIAFTLPYFLALTEV